MARNVFVSYSHRLDQNDADDFRIRFGGERMVFSDKSLPNMDLSGYSDDYIKDHFIRPRIRNSSVTIVLIGEETGGRWWVDWEIYYSMLKTEGNDRNGVLGIYLPNKRHYVPQRIEMNKNYCEIIQMPSNRSELDYYIEESYNKRFSMPNMSMPLRKRNSSLW